MLSAQCSVLGRPCHDPVLTVESVLGRLDESRAGVGRGLASNHEALPAVISSVRLSCCALF